MQHGDLVCVYPACLCPEPDRACTHPVPYGGLPDGRAHCGVVGQPVGLVKDPLAAVIDRQLEIERKARAWDEWRRRVGKADMYITWEGEALALLLERLERTA